ncbi:MAG TPA: FlgD immunoglobulin-like domain containing protein [Candidatus Krumholzibacteria bacterium]|nr:FlgD immunoglobulin-like domain containing protein [Candidatus Krumholzibacteria bacterium]
MNIHRLILVLLLGGLLPGAATAAWIGNIAMDPEPGAHLHHGQRAYVTFDYEADQEVRFWVQPVYDGSVVSGYTWSGSAIYGPGAGAHTTWWSLPTDETVSHYRIRMMSSDWSVTLLQLDVPAWYTVRPEGVWNVQYSDAPSGTFRHEHFFTVSFDGYTDRAEGVRVFIRPFTDGALSPSYVASSTSIPAGGGSGSSYFRLTTGNIRVDQLRFQIKSWDQTELIQEFFLPVDLQYGDMGLNDVVLDPPPPALLPYYHHVTVTADYECDAVGDLRYYAIPLLGGMLAPGYGYQSSVVVPAPEGRAERYWYLSASGTETDQVGVRLYDDVSSLGVELDAAYTFADDALWSATHAIAGPAVLTALEHVDMALQYHCEDPAGCRIACYPVGDGIGFTDFYYNPSPLYPQGTGTANVYCTLKEGVSAHVEGITVYMIGETDHAQLATWTFPADHFFFSPAVAVDAPETPPAAAALAAAVPNPFNPSTTLAFDLPAAAAARLDVFDVSGRRVRRLWEGTAPAGRSEVTWDGRDDGGRALPSGTYLARLSTAAGETPVRRLTLVR